MCVQAIASHPGVSGRTDWSSVEWTATSDECLLDLHLRQHCVCLFRLDVHICIAMIHPLCFDLGSGSNL